MKYQEMKYQEVMDLILDYGKAKQEIGIMIGHTVVVDDAAFQAECNHKQTVLDQICDVILQLTKKA